LIPTQGGGWSAVNPYMGEQTLNESIFSMLMNFMSFGGLLISYKSTEVKFDKRKANLYLMIGMTLFILGVSGNYLIIFIKGGI
jgi:hypothetical protein